MAFFLVIHTGYSQFKVGLFNNENLLSYHYGTKQKASQQLACAIKNMLEETKISFAMIDFLAADCGPGPFTSLRTAVTTVNGLGFALKKPLISLNSLEILLEQERSLQWPITVALYNAYNQDFYYAIEQPSTPLQIGCTSKDNLIEMCKNIEDKEKIRFVGEGVHLLKEKLVSSLGEKAYFPEDISLEPSIESFGKKAYQQASFSHLFCYQLLPIYLKAGYNLPSSL